MGIDRHKREELSAVFAKLTAEFEDAAGMSAVGQGTGSIANVRRIARRLNQLHRRTSRLLVAVQEVLQ